MFSRSVLRTALEARCINTATSSTSQFLPPTFLLPSRANLSTSSSTGTTQFQSTPPEIPPQSPPLQANAAPTASTTITSTTATSQTTSTRSKPPTPKPAPTPPTITKPLTLDSELTSLLPHLSAQSPHYITAHIHAHPYLLTAGDKLRLPFLMPSVEPGQILRLNRASVLGSRDFALKGAPYVDERLFECRARVMGVESEPMRILEKTKRRQRHVKHVRSKHKYTVLRIMEVRIKSLEELKAEGATIE